MKSVANAFVTLTLLAGLAASSILAAPGSAAPAKASPITIGEFAVAVAKAMDVAPETRATLSPEAALALLKQSGLSLTGSPDSILTEADLAAFLRQTGVQISVTSPGQSVSQAQAKSAVAGFGSLFASHAAPPPVASSSAHHGNQPPIPEAFSDCAQLPKVPDCRTCCINLGLSAQSCGRACGRAHAALQVSASEPTP